MKSVIEMEVKLPQQVFTHLDHNGVGRTFLIETMQEFYKKFPKCMELMFCTVPIDQHISDYLRTNHGIEQARLDRLVDPHLSEPIIGILWKDGETTIVDGGHRVVKNFELGKTGLRAVLFKYPFWEQFMLPEEHSRKAIEAGCLTNDSNIIEKEKDYGRKS